jgi:hypothetical protein
MVIGVLAGGVLLAGAGVLLATQRGDDELKDKPPAPKPVEFNPEPKLVPGYSPTVDQRLGGVRVLATEPVDAPEIVRAYTAARKRFEEHLKGKGLAFEDFPVNLVVASDDLMCRPELYAPSAAPPNCGTREFFYKTFTLHVRRGKDFELNLLKGAATHVCMTTEALLKKGCINILEPFWNELEKKQ